MFADRIEAGKKLSEALGDYHQDSSVVVLALPRGGVVVAAEVARQLNAPLDIVVVRKIGAPENPEYAIGAITEYGDVVFNEIERAQIDPRWLNRETQKEKNEAERRVKAYRKKKIPMDLKNKTVIIIDDGLATGLTMKAAIQSIRKFKPNKTILAVPVAAKDSLQDIRGMVDETVALQVPEFFDAVGRFYESFPQVSDDEVMLSLKRVSESL